MSFISLAFDKGTLSSEFSSDTTEYTLTVPVDTDTVSLTASLIITVYAEDHKTSRTYTIAFTKR